MVVFETGQVFWAEPSSISSQPVGSSKPTLKQICMLLMHCMHTAVSSALLLTVQKTCVMDLLAFKIYPGMHPGFFYTLLAAVFFMRG